MSDERLALVASPTAAGAGRRSASCATRYDWVPLEEADMIVALGGDGFMLQTLHAMLDRRGDPVPVFGMNLGTVGFLMNEWRRDGLDERLDARQAVQGHAAADDRASRSPARRSSLPGDQRSLAAARNAPDRQAGSHASTTASCCPNWPATACSSRRRRDRPRIICRRNGPILPLGSALIALTPISPFRPRRWRGAILPDKARIGLRVLEPAKRPVSRGRRPARSARRRAGRRSRSTARAS